MKLYITKVTRYARSQVLPKSENAATREINRAADELNASNTEVFVVLEENVVVGAMSLTVNRSSDEVNISHIGSTVKGCGTMLIQYAVLLAQRRRLSKIRLCAYNSAVGFYLKLGFVRAPKHADGSSSNVLIKQVKNENKR